MKLENIKIDVPSEQKTKLLIEALQNHYNNMDKENAQLKLDLLSALDALQKTREELKDAKKTIDAYIYANM